MRVEDVNLVTHLLKIYCDKYKTIFYTCPSCKNEIDIKDKISEYCPFCGEKLTSEKEN
ncbi:hypothetical protein FACS1894132_07330 [Clostridia bacterium]|nr:hypothetical protein FACS1894132_07330 [Clostridia bacterium]